MIIQHANTTFEHAQLIYKGQIGDNITRNYYIQGDLVYVVNTDDTAFITVYKIDLGFTEELNTTVRKGLLEEIARLQEEKYEIECSMAQEVESKEQEIGNIEDELSILQARMKHLEDKKKFTRQEINNIKGKSIDVGLSIRKHTLTLVNSQEYKKDLQSIK
ncbi:hypothetical protein D3C79_877210 [compost metagenome]